MKALHSITLAALLGFSSVASAAIFKWESVIPQTPASDLFGSFTLDTSTNTFSDVNLDFASSTSNSLTPSDTYTFLTYDSVLNKVTSTGNDFLSSFEFTPGTNIVNNTIPFNPIGINWNIDGGDLVKGGVSGYTSFAVTAVPEPATYAMFLAGLGLLGFARRAKQA
jgi:hypothetical protein